ncbi:fungal specific transcription factor, putative [Talaromyces stipitatus ATCC 10500]|uniref:Fungal specific transcription factor, putative n=1 Tax=Talaromyces stipitatus (strain ATCC 10500 / CBS 375.48 / QM 6759 / NRRL 1006) TaxID=441959 RepID=B8LVH0_TALSN|nr:fungal specific transcription factor, putative [Talaromyces stipitatus ATCC 10500]EED23989.1 fungal specific transcription factor, putative [Talaromyces stipitatus ATCC 10500]
MNNVPSSPPPGFLLDPATPSESVAQPKGKRRRTTRDAPQKRATRACDQCRRLKEKCEGGVPCTRCVRFKRICRFKDSMQTDCEIANTAEMLERMAYMERILKRQLGVASLDTRSLASLANAIAESEDDEVDTASLSDEAQLSIEDEVCTIFPIEDTTTHYSGEFSYFNFSMRLKSVIEDRIAGSITERTGAQDQDWNYWRAKHLLPASNTISVALSCLPPRQVADFLISIFFTYAETHHFYVEKAWLLRKVDALYTYPWQFGMKDVAVISIILTILAIGTQYAYLDSPGRKTAESNTGSVFSEDELGALFYREAIRFLPEIIESSSLESVQACLLFAAYSLPIDAGGLGYIYINITIRLAMQNGMHRKYTGDELGAAMVETRNRVWWTTYVLERKISIFHGRPLAMWRSDIDTQLPKDWKDITHAPTFSYMAVSISLTQWLEDFFHEMSQLRNCQKQNLYKIFSHLMMKKNELEEWWAMLPSEVLDGRSQSSTEFRSAMHVQLEYCLLRMFLGRPFLLSRVESSPEHTCSEDGRERRSPTERIQKQKSDRKGLVDCCIGSAKQVLDICRTLRYNEPGLARASYIEYSSCRAALLVLIAYSIQNQSNQSRQHLRDGIDMIREMSTSGDSARSEVRLIEMLERAVVRLHVFNPQRHRDGETTFSDQMTSVSGYESLKHWEAVRKGSSRTFDGESRDYSNASQLLAPPRTVSARTFDNHTTYREPQQGLMVGVLNQSRDGTTPTVPTDRDPNLNLLRPFYSPAELALFGARDMATSNSTMHPEAQVLDQFLAMSDPGFFPSLGLGGGNGLGSMGLATDSTRAGDA